MKSILKCIQENLFDNPQQIFLINNTVDTLNIYFEDNIPEEYDDIIKEQYSASYIISEHIKSVNANKTLEYIRKQFDADISNSYVDNNLIYITFKDYKSIDIDKLNRILNTYKYILHTIIGNNTIYEPLLEDNYNDYIYGDCNGIVFHLTDRITANKILDKGLRPKYAEHETKKNLKDKQNSNINYKGKIYVLAIKDLYNIHNRISEVKNKIFNKPNDIVVLKIKLPKGIDFYKDNAMYDDMSYFTYVPIQSKYIELIKI
ncbi:MAG: hypothetical protein J6D03_05600 [Clostridia bacterium]|nr:hypothetical protein [Clostridia bacterium]